MMGCKAAFFFFLLAVVLASFLLLPVFLSALSRHWDSLSCATCSACCGLQRRVMSLELVGQIHRHCFTGLL